MTVGKFKIKSIGIDSRGLRGMRIFTFLFKKD